MKAHHTRPFLFYLPFCIMVARGSPSKRSPSPKPKRAAKTSRTSLTNQLSSNLLAAVIEASAFANRQRLAHTSRAMHHLVQTSKHYPHLKRVASVVRNMNASRTRATERVMNTYGADQVVGAVEALQIPPLSTITRGRIDPSRVFARSREIRDADMVKLCITLPFSPLMQTATSINLGFNQIGDVGMSAFAQAIKPVGDGGTGSLPVLEELDLQGNRIGDKGLEDFADSCAKGGLTMLQHLYLSYNNLSDVGVTALAGAYLGGALPRLRRLGLVKVKSRNSDHGMKALAEALATRTLRGSLRLQNLIVNDKYRRILARQDFGTTRIIYAAPLSQL